MGRAPDNEASRSSGRAATNRSAWWAVVRFGVFVCLIGGLLSLAALPWVNLSWWKIFRRCVSIASVISLWLCIRKFERRSFESYGLSLHRGGGRQWLFGLLLGLGALGLMLGIGLATGLCRIALTPDRVKLYVVVLGFIPAVALISVLEELVFRGFILQQLLSQSRVVAVLASSTLYSLVHLKEPTLDVSTALQLGGLFLLGVALCLGYLRTGQLYLSMGLHAALAYGARVNKLLIEFTDLSLSWLAGTSRLVNGLAGWAMLLGIGGVLFWWKRLPTQGGRDERA